METQFKAYLNLKRIFTDTLNLIRTIAKDELNKRGLPEVATVNIIDGTRITATNEEGLTRITRDGS
jgi:hypothetical protein